MLVGAANEQDIRTGLPPEAGVHIGGQQRGDEIAEVLDAVDVGNGTRDEIAGHVRILAGGCRTPRNQKALPLGRKSSGSALASRGRASTLPATFLAVGPVHSLVDDDGPGLHDQELTERM